MSRLLREGTSGLFTYAKSIGYIEPAEGFASRCDVCFQIRKYLIANEPDIHPDLTPAAFRTCPESPFHCLFGGISAMLRKRLLAYYFEYASSVKNPTIKGDAFMKLHTVLVRFHASVSLQRNFRASLPDENPTRKYSESEIPDRL